MMMRVGMLLMLLAVGLGTAVAFSILIMLRAGNAATGGMLLLDYAARLCCGLGSS